MSKTARDWAWNALPFSEGKTRPATRKLLLLYLAERANNEGECFPGVDSISAATRLDPRTVLYGLADLQDEGLLAIERRVNARGHRTSNRYRLALAHRLPKPGAGPAEPWPIEIEAASLSANVAPRVDPGLSATAAGLSVSSAGLSAKAPPEPERENQKVNRQRESARARAAAGAACSLPEFLEMTEIQEAAVARRMPPAILEDCLQKFIDHHETRRHTPATWQRMALRWIKAEQFDAPSAPPPTAAARNAAAWEHYKRHNHREAVRIMDEHAEQALEAEGIVPPREQRTPAQKQKAVAGLRGVKDVLAGLKLPKPEDES